jgi:Ca-activated chloride channel family protein
MTTNRSIDGLWRNMLMTWLAALGVGMATSLLLFAAALLFSSGVHASVENSTALSGYEPVSEAFAGLRLVAADGASTRAPSVQNSAEMDISGMLARVKVSQRFLNPSNDWVEGVYLFPLPEEAAVDRLRLVIGERVIEGEIQPRAQARERYRQAKQSGQRASLLTQQRPNIFTTAVANIGPGEAVSIELEYQQNLSYDQGQFAIRYPMVVAPRYIPGVPLGGDSIEGFGGDGWAVDTDQVADASRITPPLAPSNDRAPTTELEIRLDPGFPLEALTSSYHDVEVEKRDDRYLVKLRQGVTRSDRDFELRWRPQTGKAPAAALFTEQWEGENYALLMLMPPLPGVESQPIVQREMVFVIDTSGSMHGASILQAKAALRIALQRLRPEDRFNLIRFSQRTEALFERSEKASGSNVQRALAYLEALQAEGGTEMMPALRRALARERQDERLRQVVFVTDGSVGNESALFELIRQRLGSSRLFTVGIGSAPNSHFMRRAAEFGRGSFTYIGSIPEVSQRMGSLFKKLESPALTDLELHLPQALKAELHPSHIPDLYLGEPVVVALKWPGSVATATVQGRIGARPWEKQVKLNGGSPSPGVHALWARRAIDEITASAQGGSATPAQTEKMLALALKHKLVSKQTSLVAVDKTPVRPQGDALKARSVPVAMPHGWVADRVFGHLPQTATSAPFNLLLGVLSLLAAALLWALQGSNRRHGWHRG